MFTSISAENAEGNVGSLGAGTLLSLAGWPTGGFPFTACKPAAMKQQSFRSEEYIIILKLPYPRYRTQSAQKQVTVNLPFPGRVLWGVFGDHSNRALRKNYEGFCPPASIANRNIIFKKNFLIICTRIQGQFSNNVVQFWPATLHSPAWVLTKSILVTLHLFYTTPLVSCSCDIIRAALISCGRITFSFC